MKDLWLKIHEELVAEYLEAHPGVSWSAAYDLTADRVNDRLIDQYSAAVDYWHTVMKEPK
jgi:hypothetical protein